MYELVYTSVASKGISNESLEGILRVSRRNNQANEISGLLVFDGTTFFQILEGNENDVNNLFSVVERDDRHFEINLYHSGPIEQRSFAQWAMSFKLLDGQEPISGWMEWLQTQNVIHGITPKDSLGCRILKLAYDV